MPKSDISSQIPAKGRAYIEETVRKLEKFDRVAKQGPPTFTVNEPEDNPEYLPGEMSQYIKSETLRYPNGTSVRHVTQDGRYLSTGIMKNGNEFSELSSNGFVSGAGGREEPLWIPNNKSPGRPNPNKGPKLNPNNKASLNSRGDSDSQQFKGDSPLNSKGGKTEQFNGASPLNKNGGKTEQFKGDSPLNSKGGKTEQFKGASPLNSKGGKTEQQMRIQKILSSNEPKIKGPKPKAPSAVAKTTKPNPSKKPSTAVASKPAPRSSGSMKV